MLAEKLNAELPKPGAAAVFVWLAPNGLAAAAAGAVVAAEPNIDAALALFAEFAPGDEKLNADDCWLPYAGGAAVFVWLAPNGLAAPAGAAGEPNIDVVLGLFADVAAGAGFVSFEVPKANGVEAAGLLAGEPNIGLADANAFVAAGEADDC